MESTRSRGSDRAPFSAAPAHSPCGVAESYLAARTPKAHKRGARHWPRFFGHAGEIISTDAPITDLGFVLSEEVDRG